MADVLAPFRGPWDDLLAEAQAFQAWYAPTHMNVDAWVGLSADGALYGGWAVEGDKLYDEWDESEMTTASGATVEDVIKDLIGIAQRYRERRDAEHADSDYYGKDIDERSDTGGAAPLVPVEAHDQGGADTGEGGRLRSRSDPLEEHDPHAQA